MTSLGPIHFSPPPPPLACVRKYVCVRRLPLPPYNVDEQRQSVACDIYNIEPGVWGRGDNKDVGAVETKKSAKKFAKREVLITRLARIEASVKIFGKTDQAIDYISATLQMIGVRCCGVSKKKNNNNPVAEANRGGSCLHVICRYEKKLFADIKITQSTRLASATLFIVFLFRDTGVKRVKEFWSPRVQFSNQRKRDGFTGAFLLGPS